MIFFSQLHRSLNWFRRMVSSRSRKVKIKQNILHYVNWSKFLTYEATINYYFNLKWEEVIFLTQISIHSPLIVNIPCSFDFFSVYCNNCCIALATFYTKRIIIFSTAMHSQLKYIFTWILNMKIYFNIIKLLRAKNFSC